MQMGKPARYRGSRSISVAGFLTPCQFSFHYPNPPKTRLPFLLTSGHKGEGSPGHRGDGWAGGFLGRERAHLGAVSLLQTGSCVARTPICLSDVPNPHI